MNAEEELRLLQDTWTKVYQMYLTWFAWHFGTHSVILGGVFSIEGLRVRAGLIALFIGWFAVLSVGASIAMLFHEYEIRRRLAQLPEPHRNWVYFGGAAAVYSTTATLLTNSSLIFAWAYVFLAPPS